MAHTHHRRSRLRLEPLERRDAPATLVGNNKVTYQDVDGDTVTVAFSKPILNVANVNTVFAFDTGFVFGSNAAKQQLRRIDLTSLGVAANGTRITTSAVRSPVNGGDGFAALGQIDATGIDLGPVGIDGDLGRVLAGDAIMLTSGLRGLTVQWLGRYGTSTGAPDLHTEIQGNLDLLRVRSDFKDAIVSVKGGGRLGSVSIGGSLIGGADDFSGRIVSQGPIGMVRIVGNVEGGIGAHSGEIRAETTLAGVIIGGSLVGGAGQGSGHIFADGDVGPVRIAGNVLGMGGNSSGEIFAEQLGSVRIGGSLVGGAGTDSARIYSQEDMGAVRIGGNIQGAGPDSGKIWSDGTLAGLTIGGSVVGGTGDWSGSVHSEDAMGAVRIAGDLVGGSASGAAVLIRAGFVSGQRIASISLGGSLIAGVDNTSGNFRDNGAIRADDDIGSVFIKGSMVGNRFNPAIISARGQAMPTPTIDVAIGSVRILGRVEYGKILAGVDANDLDRNADAQIGPVFVGRDWIASSIAAGADTGNGYFGDASDVKMSGAIVKDDTFVLAKIKSLTIGGQVFGTEYGLDHFGVVAEIIGAVKIGGTQFVLQAGKSNDDVAVGLFGDFRVNEI